MRRKSLQIASFVIIICSVLATGCAEREGKEWRGLSPEVRETLRTTFPGLFVRKVEVDYKERVKLFEVTFKLDKKEMEARLTPQGTVVEILTKVDDDDEIPETVKDAIPGEVDTESLNKIQKVKIFATLKDGACIPLEHPKTAYEIRYRIFETQPEAEGAGS